MSDDEIEPFDQKRWKETAKLPFGTTTIYIFSLISPYTWWRISVLKKHCVSLPSIFEGVAALSVISLGSWMLSLRRIERYEKHANVTLTSFLPNVGTYLVSSFALAIIVRVGHFVKMVATDVINQYKQRSQATTPAWECLADLIVSDRAYRTMWYDVYLPCSKSEAHQLEFEKSIPILFLPGATVEHSAYAAIGRLLAEYGYVVVIMSLEPLRLADGFLSGSNHSFLCNVMKKIKSEHYSHSGLKNEHWVLLGHSMGSLAATKLVCPLGIRRLVMVGSAPFIGFMDDISQSGNEVQVIQGSNDMVIESFGNPELVSQFWKKLPPNAEKNCHVIEGGTHSGFANYISCWKPEVDGISVRDQQIETVRLIDTFIRNTVVASTH